MIPQWLRGWGRCRFCLRWSRSRLNGTCQPCVEETLEWLDEQGCVVTWPLESTA